jgi:hypothetical protein
VAEPAPPPPPSPSLPFSSGAEMLSSDPRRTRTFRAVDQIRTSLTIYLFVPLLGAFEALIITAVLLASNAYVAGNFAGSGIGGIIESNSPAISISGELIAIVVFILTIVAWVNWRRGVHELGAASGEYGPRHVGAVRRAEEDYRYTVYTYIATFVFGIAVVGIILALVFGTIVQDVNSGESSATAVANVIGGLVGLLLVVGVIGVALTVLLYHFATRSQIGSLAAIASPETVAGLRQARTLILVGAALQIAGAGALSDRLLYPLALVSPLVLVVGVLRMRSAYSEWLRNPPPPTGAPAPVPWYASPGSFPPPPPPRA